jgi:predicted TIM-barrel enzyme
LRPVIDTAVVDAFKRENRGKKDAIVENDDDNPTC